MNSIRRIAMAGFVVVALATPAAARQATSVTQADVQRLQDNIYLAERDVQQARTRDSARATQLTSELDDLRDEVIYLKVKLRKERTLARTEWADVRDRIDDLRSRARGDAPATSSTAPPSSSSPVSSAAPPPPAAGSRPPQSSPSPTASTSPAPAPAGSIEIPAGTELDARLQSVLNSGTAQVEDRFEATTLVDVNVSGRTVIPAGSVLRGVVTAVEPATRTNRTAKMTVSFDQVTVGGRAYPIRGTVSQAIQGEGIKGETGRIATGAGVGAIIGGILGGGKGALLGVLVGGGGITAATEGKEVELPQGAVLRVRLDSPASIQPPAR
jgi:TolA-binding protein